MHAQKALVPNSVVRAATRTAEIIHAVKITLIVLNMAGSLFLILAGILWKPGVDEMGRTRPGSSPLWFVPLAQGAAGLIFGSLVILVVFGWFEHMLRTNAELVRLAAPVTATY
jgi:hypothetical protein